MSAQYPILSVFFTARQYGLRLVTGLLLAYSAAVSATPIDLNQFYADAPVSVAADGSSATLGEDLFYYIVLLQDVPFFGDPELIVASAGATLQFDYVFNEPVADGNSDLFHAVLYDDATGFAISGAEIFVTDSGSDTVVFDLDPLVGTTLDLSFELTQDLNGFDVGLSSTVTISNVQIITASTPPPPPPPTPTPSPGTSLLLLGGLLVLHCNVRRRKYIAHSA